MLSPAESSLSVPCPDTPFIHFHLPGCCVPALTRPICSTCPAAHVCHSCDEAVTVRIHVPAVLLCPGAAVCSGLCQPWLCPSWCLQGQGSSCCLQAVVLSVCACTGLCSVPAVPHSIPGCVRAVHRHSEVTLAAEPFREHFAVP